MTTTLAAQAINARIDRLPWAAASMRVVALLSLGGFFEIYDLFLTAYIGPGMVQSGLFTQTTASFFGASGLGAFVFATFAGLFVGTIALAPAADRHGRRRIFTWSLMWYATSTLIMCFQTGGNGVILWRFIAGIGIGVQLVTIDTYVSELVPSRFRGRAFALNRAISWSAIPIVALLAWKFVPTREMGWDGWRWVAAFGGAGALIVLCLILRGVPESPRWLAQKGELEEADRIVIQLEKSSPKSSAEPVQDAPFPGKLPAGRAAFAEIWKPPYRGRTIMLMVFNFFQTIAVYGFASWVPTLVVAKGNPVPTSLFYSFAIALANPIAPILGIAIIDTFERKWIIVSCALISAVCGLIFVGQTSGAVLIALGMLITLSNQGMALSFHAYQSELFPTRVRARAVGFVYSLSRVSAALNGFCIPFLLHKFGVVGPFGLIACSFLVVIVAIGIFGPQTTGLPLEEISH